MRDLALHGSQVERLGARRKEAVQRLCWAGPPEEPEAALAVAYASGLLELRDPAGQVLSTASTAADVKCLQAG